MKGKVLVSKFWTDLFSLGKASAITIFPFVFVRERSMCNDITLLNHERIHIRQAIEMLILPFYIWYFVEFLWRYIQCRNFRQAYLNISFEREAYHNEQNLQYLKSRKAWQFYKYL